MKRFYKLVSTRAEAAGHAVLLDGKPVRTPGKNLLLAPNEKLAGAVMREWADQKEAIRPDDMPLTQILSTKIDRVGSERRVMEKMLLDYLDTDLLCYRAPAPPELKARQEAAWDLWIKWFAEKSGVKLIMTENLDALKQPAAAHDYAVKHLAALDDDKFTVLQLAAAFSGSLLLGMAFAAGAATADEIFAAARVEETYKGTLYDEKKYGADPAQEKKDAAALKDLKAAQEYLKLL